MLTDNLTKFATQREVMETYASLTAAFVGHGKRVNKGKTKHVNRFIVKQVLKHVMLVNITVFAIKHSFAPHVMLLRIIVQKTKFAQLEL
jgi:hypothetical protein